MVKTVSGDLLEFTDGIICHQVNYLGVMGGGVAAAIRESVLTEDQYNSYVSYCKKYGRTALGTVQFIGGGLIVANMFCQEDFIAAGISATDYTALRACLIRVRSMARIQGKRVYVPYHIGCGIARGEWGIVEGIIRDVFNDYPVKAFIVKRPRNNGETV